MSPAEPAKFVGGAFWQRLALAPDETVVAQTPSRRDRGLSTYGKLFLTNQRLLFARSWFSPVFMFEHSWSVHLSAIERLTIFKNPGLFAFWAFPSFGPRRWIKFRFDHSENGFIFSDPTFERALTSVASHCGWHIDGRDGQP